MCGEYLQKIVACSKHVNITILNNKENYKQWKFARHEPENKNMKLVTLKQYISVIYIK